MKPKPATAAEMMMRALKEERQFVFIAEFDGGFLHVSGTATPEWVQKVLPAVIADMQGRKAHEFTKQ